MSIHQFSEVSTYLPKIYGAYPEVLCMTSTRSGGVSTGQYASLNLGIHVGDVEEHVSQNRTRFCEAAGIPPEFFTLGQQVHGTQIALISESERGTVIPETDGLITSLKNTPLCILTADCVALSFFDPVQQVIGVAHAGWRGTVHGIAPKMIELFKQQFGSTPADIIVSFSPSISQKNYEVGSDVQEVFAQYFPQNWQDFLQETDQKPQLQKWLLSLEKALLHQLHAAGVLAGNIEVSDICTVQNTDQFYSHRGEQGKTGRFGTVMMLR